ncbi:MAG: hypothetical protein ACRDJH_21465 [Thermomicrobiales bacterium]
MSNRAGSTNTYLWCNACRRSFSHDDASGGICPVCGAEVRAVSKWNAILRGLMANQLVASDLPTKHRQIVRLIWTRNGMTEQYYRVLAPDMPINKFEAGVTDLLCRGAEEGWVRIVLPPAPSNDESAYRIEFTDEERFVAELDRLARSAGKK